MGSFTWRLMLLLACTAWLGAWDYYSNIDEEPPGGRDFWLGSTAGNVIVWGVPFAVAAIVARFWVLVAAVGFVIDRVQLEVRGQLADFGDNREPLEDPLLWVTVLPIVLGWLALGVVAGRSVRSALDRRATARSQSM
jgi:hypothetical protein